MMIDTPERAMRRARVIAQDLALYHADKIKLGIETDTFFEELHDLLEEHRQHYKARIAPELDTKSNYFDLAVVDTILNAAEINSKIW